MRAARTHLTLGHWAEGDRPWLRVTVHETNADLRRAAARLRPGEEWGDTYGCFQPTPWRERYDTKAGKWKRSGTRLVGTIRVSLESISPEVVAHECAHAALCVYRQHWRPDGNVGEDCGEDEEMFAYILGDVTAVVADTLRVLRVDWVSQ